MFYVYLLASGRNGTLYVGHTDNLLDRLSQHRDGTYGGFTSRYGVKTLVWYELHESREEAFRRERQLKTWNRLRKIELIEKRNIGWRDLASEL